MDQIDLTRVGVSPKYSAVVDSVNRPHSNGSVHTNGVQQVDKPIRDVNEAAKSMGSALGLETLHTAGFQQVDENATTNKGENDGTMGTTSDGTMLFGPNHTDGTHRTDNDGTMGSVESFASVKSKFENSLVGYFIGKSLAFPIV
ncbi:hypothetical protein Tco_0015749 [Tanacetum coccineum]